VLHIGIVCTFGTALSEVQCSCGTGTIELALQITNTLTV